MASISSTAEFIFVVRAGAESVAVKAAVGAAARVGVGTEVGTKLGAGSAKFVSCEESTAAATAGACSSLMTALGMAALGGCVGTLSFV